MIYLLHHSIFESALRTPDKEAFRCNGKVLLYEDLAIKINQLANLLESMGLKKGDRIGIYLNRSIETAIAIYGIMNAGGIYVPLDPKAPASRTSFLLNDCGIKILISSPTQKRRLQQILKQKTSLSTIIGIADLPEISSCNWQDLDQQSDSFSPRVPILENDPAYIMYTSGSTGNPKGIVHTHYSGLSYAKLTSSTYQITAADRVANHAPIFFDISLFGYFTAPYVGATTSIATDAHTVLPVSLSKFIEEEKITIWYSVTLALIQMVQKGMLETRDLNGLRWMLYAGEACPPKYLAAAMKTLPKVRFANIYGPAETNQCTHYEIPEAPQSDDPIPIGHVWDNTEKVILDSEEKELEGPSTGELCIRSATMMRGYWQKPELTESSFFYRQNNSGSHDVFYKTGDLVRLDEAGFLHFLGRKDHQIKIRGYRVELNSIEIALVSHEGIAEAAVFTTQEKDEPIQIHAAVTLKRPENILEKDLLQYLKNKLPHYAIPSSITMMDSFPRTGSGKVKRSELKEGIGLN